MIGREQETRKFRDRAAWFNFVVLFFFGLVVLRLYHLQVMMGSELRRYSEANRLKKEKLFPPRGIIYDRDGKVIVDSRASFDVVMIAQYYPFTEKVDKRLRKVLGMSEEDFERKIRKARKEKSFHPVLIESDVSKDVIAAIEMDTEEFPGVYIEASVQRRYPYEAISSQVLGYVGEVNDKEIKSYSRFGLEMGDYVGKVGLEKTYDEYLRGVVGAGYVEVDARGRRRRTEEGKKLFGFAAQTEPVEGSALHLTLDMDLGVAAYEAMKKNEFNGSVVALDPRNGEVLVMLNFPTYDPETISGREVSSKVWAQLSQDEQRPLRNRAIMDHYPPGSTFKLFMAVAGMAEGLIHKDTKVDCKGYMRLGNRKFHCWKKHGIVDLTRSIKESCDFFYYKVGLDLGVDLMARYARMFGLGEKTGINLPGEESGLIPDSKWKMERYQTPWQKGETLPTVIGQSFVLATPLQMANAFAALGNGGFAYRPYLVKRIVNQKDEVVREFKPELHRRAQVDPQILDLAKQGAYEVVNEPKGTAWWSRSRMIGFAGKTGTSQVRRFDNIKAIKCPEMPYADRHHGWFVAFAPKKNPQIAVAVVAEHNCGGARAAPVARDVIEAFVKKYPIPEEELLIPKALPAPREVAKDIKAVTPAEIEGDEVPLVEEVDE